MTTSATATTTAPQKKPDGLIQQLEAILGRPLTSEAKNALEAMLINVTRIGIQAASFASEAARERVSEAHDLAAAHVTKIMAEATP